MTIQHNLPEATYHARPELSSTGARLLLPEYKGSPAKFQWAKSHPRTSRAFDVGHATHAKVLGVGASVIAYPAEHLTAGGNVSTKAATVEWEQEQRGYGLTPVSPDDIERVDAMAEAVLSHETARPFFEVAAHREVSVFATIDDVPVRARFDALSDETRNGVYAIDLKTTEDATPDGFTRSVSKWGYDTQQAWYEDVYTASEGHRVDRFILVAIEKTAPFEVTVCELPEMWVAMGRTKAAASRRIFRECTDTGVWPGYDPSVQYLDPPAWAVIDYEMRYEGGEINI
jgi:hypothetical protein